MTTIITQMQGRLIHNIFKLRGQKSTNQDKEWIDRQIKADEVTLKGTGLEMLTEKQRKQRARGQG